MRDDEVRERVAELETLLEELDERAAPAVAALAAVYGEGLRRIVAALHDAPAVAETLARDELVSHLLILHDLRGDAVIEHVATVPAGVRAPRGADVGGMSVDGDGKLVVSLL